MSLLLPVLAPLTSCGNQQYWATTVPQLTQTSTLRTLVACDPHYVHSLWQLFSVDRYL
jgi:hypothetical protein